MKKVKKFQQGSALVTLAFFMLISSVVTAAAIAIILTSSRSTTNVEQGIMAYHAAEAGIDEGLLQILRGSNVTALFSETATPVGNGTTFDVTVATNGTVNATGRYNGFVRQIQVTSTYNNGVLTINTWQEIF